MLVSCCGRAGWRYVSQLHLIVYNKGGLMAKRTIQSCWKQYEKLARDYLDERRPLETVVEDIETLTHKANNDDVGESLTALFVRPYLPLDISVKFTAEFDDGVPSWQTRYEKYEDKSSCILLHPVSIYRFCRQAASVEVDGDEYDDFLELRALTFQQEIGKLPSLYILFMMILQRTAFLMEIAHLEKRGGVVEIAEDESYHTLLWAFKEFEAFAKRSWGVEIRAKHNISWYESDWITGR